MSSSSPRLLPLGEDELGLATDLYQLTMVAAYLRRGPAGKLPRACFELFVRSLPPRRSFLVFAGLEQAVAALTRLRFTAEQLAYLRSLPQFATVGTDFFEYLEAFRFRADVWALPEGSIFFPEEPVLRVTGDLIEAQLVETLLLSILNFQTAIVTKAARIRLAAGEAQLAEFGGRRAHGPQAAAWVARAAWVAGFDATSNLLAGQRLGIPVVGTMAHSYVLGFAEEREAFEHYRRIFPEHTILLVDTHDTLEGLRAALTLEEDFQGVRLDSGDLASLARAARRMLDDAGRPHVQILVSGDLDEESIAALRRDGAPIDAYGVGTRLASCVDAPFVSGVYKLVAVEEGGVWRGRHKSSPGKASRPGIKQVQRRYDGGSMAGDTVVPAAAGGLLVPVLENGEPCAPVTTAGARERCAEELKTLPPALRGLVAADPAYPIHFDSRLADSNVL